MKWLYRYEAKSIQRWILATDRLRELKGGSTLVEELQTVSEKAAHGAMLYAAAGAGTAMFPTREALERFARWWPAYVSRHAPGLDLVQAWTDDGQMRTLQAKLGAARNRPWPTLPEVGPWVARAGRSGLPAVERDEIKGGLVDAGTGARERAGRNNDALGELLSTSLGSDWKEPTELAFEDELSEYPADEGVAVVHADGNGIGKVVHGLTLEGLVDFSHRLREASLAAGRRAVAGLARYEVSRSNSRHDGNGRLILNGRPIVAGGDDFTFLVRGRAGIALACEWLRAFEQETKRRGIAGGEGLTACAGVVFVRRGFPFGQAHDLAEALCSTAKGDRRAENGGSRIAFHRVTTSLHGGEQSPSWTLQEMSQLNTLVRYAARLPRGKLRQWLGEHNEERAARLWARLREVAEQNVPQDWKDFGDTLDTFDGPRTDAVRASLQWSRVSPLAADRLWGAA